MAALPELREPSTELERLIRDVFELDHLQFHLLLSDQRWLIELFGRSKIYYRGDHWNVDVGFEDLAGWHVHAQLGAIKRVRMVREPNPFAPGQERINVYFVLEGGESLRCSCRRLYDEHDRPIAKQWARWEALQAKYGGPGEFQVQDGNLLAPAATGA